MHVNIVCGLYTIFYIQNYVTDTYYLTIYNYPYVHNIKMKFMDCCFGLVGSQFICCLHIFL